MKGPAPWVWTTLGSCRWQISHSFYNACLLERLWVPERLLLPPAEPLRNPDLPRATHLVKTVLEGCSLPPVVVKQYRHRGLWHAFKELFGKTRARRAFEKAWFLERCQITTAKPIAAGEVRRFGVPWESYFLAEQVPGACPLRQLRGVAGEARRGRQLMRVLGRTMARLHNVGLAHSDPSLSNFLARGDAAGGWEVVVIDLDALRPVRRVPRRVALRNLRRLMGRIPMSSRERLWFAAEYCRTRSERWSARQLLAGLWEGVKSTLAGCA